METVKETLLKPVKKGTERNSKNKTAALFSYSVQESLLGKQDQLNYQFMYMLWNILKHLSGN